MKVSDAVCIGGNAFTYVLSAIQTKEIFQIISLAISILVSLVILLYKLWQWWKEAKKDGKITKDEIKEGAKILIDGSKDIKNQIDSHKKGEKDGKD